MRKPSAGLVVTVLTLATGCGGSEPPPEAPEKPIERATVDDSADEKRPRLMAEIGGLPPEGVQSTFDGAQNELFDCFKKGVQRVPFMGGDVKFWVKVDQKGKFMHAHLERSDLGDRKTEQCLLDVLIEKTWPTPVGGELGIATFEMGFDAADDITPPVEWDAAKVAPVVESLAAEIDECRMGLPGTFHATVYVKKALVEDEEAEGGQKEIGKALAASATPPDEAGEMVVDCLVKHFLEAEYPAPEGTPAKAAFTL